MEQRQFYLRDTLTVLFKHKQLLLLLPLFIVLVTFVGGYVWPPSFESEAKLRLTRGREVSQADPTVIGGNSLNMITMGVEDINSEIELIQNHDLLRAVVDKLQLHENEQFPFGDSILNTPFKLLRATLNQAFYLLGLKVTPQPEEEAAITLADRLEVEPVRDSFVLEVRMRLGTAQMAQEVLQAIIDEYTQRHIDIFSNTKSTGFFEERLTETKRNLDAARDAVESFRAANDITLLDVEQQILVQQFSDAKRVLTQLAETEEAISGRDIDSSLISSLSSQTDSTVVREMQLRLLELLLERNRVVQTLGPAHPTVLSLGQQVRSAQESLLEAIANTKAITQKKMDTAKTRLSELNSTKKRYDELDNEVNLLNGQFAFYTSKLEESRVADALAKQQVSSVKTMTKPNQPVDPVRPNKLLNLVLALVGGVVFSFAMAFLLDYFDHGLKTPEDIEAHTGIPALASFFNAAGQAPDAREAERLSVLLDNLIPGQSQVIQVTSSVPGEGSGAIAVAISEAFGNDSNVATVLIDLSGDATKGKRVTGGITEVLAGESTFDAVFPAADGLTIVGRGNHQMPAYLRRPEVMNNLLEQLRRRYKYVVFHVGPVLVSHEAVRLARYTDGVVVVVKANATRRQVVERAVNLFEKGKVLGAVLTQRTQTIPQAVYRRI